MQTSGRRDSGRQHPFSGYRSDRVNEPSPLNTHADETAWWHGLSERSLPPQPEPLAAFHQRSVVIGVGDAGAEAIELIAERLRSGNLINTNSDLILIHLRMPNVTNQAHPLERPELENAGILHVISLDGQASIDPNVIHQPQWEWARLKGIRAGGEHTVRRYAARIVLFNDLQLGHYISRLSQLIQRLLSSGYDQYYLVGSAMEYVGSNLIGDLAALIRCRANPLQPPHIDALVLTQGTNNDLVGNAYQQRNYLAASLHELSRLATLSRTKVQFNAEAQGELLFNPNAEPVIVLDSFNIFSGDDPKGLQRLAYFLWGVLTSQRLRTATLAWLTPQIARDQFSRPTANVVYTHALLWQVSLWRELQIEQFLLDFIGPDQAAAYTGPRDIYTDLRAINRLLDDVREQGLLPSILLMRGIAPQPLRQDGLYYDSVISVLQETLRSAKQRISRLDGELARFRGEDYARHSGPYLKERIDELLVGAVASLRSRIGWMAAAGEGQYRVCLKFAIAPSRGRAEPKFLFNPARDVIRRQYIGSLRDYAARTVTNALDTGCVPELLGSLNDEFLEFHDEFYDFYDDLRQTWPRHFNLWTTEEFGEILYTPPPPPIPHRFLLDAPPSWGDPVEDCQQMPGTDKTFALQGTIVPYIPIRHLRAAQPSELAENLLDPMEQITYDVFRDQVPLYDVPLDLRAALANRREIWDFFQVWRSGLLPRLYRPTMPWKDRLWGFISRHKSCDQQILDLIRDASANLARAADELPSPPEPDPSPDREFGSLLMHVFDRFANHLDELTAFPPPD